MDAPLAKRKFSRPASPSAYSTIELTPAQGRSIRSQLGLPRLAKEIPSAYARIELSEDAKRSIRGCFARSLEDGKTFGERITFDVLGPNGIAACVLESGAYVLQSFMQTRKRTALAALAVVANVVGVPLVVAVLGTSDTVEDVAGKVAAALNGTGVVVACPHGRDSSWTHL